MNMKDFFNWVQGSQQPGSIGKMTADYNNRFQTQIPLEPKKENEYEEIDVDTTED
jgi:hypothetical protein